MISHDMDNCIAVAAIFGFIGGIALIISLVCGLHWFKHERGEKRGALCGGWALTVGVFVILCFAVVSACTFGALNSASSSVAKAEATLNAQYVQNQNVLSTYVTGFTEQLGVANLQTAKIEGIITQAVAGQSSLSNLANPGTSPLYSALVEAYPNVTLSQYQQLIAYVQQGRQQFQDSQAKLLSELSAFDTWRDSGFFFHPLLVSFSGAPNNQLHVTVGNTTLYGSAAEAQMWDIVRNPTALNSFATGTEQPLINANGS